ncbi:hypothetical protein OIDMADRAFT_19781 [Oidiodendron maius Zn]|uniref:Uncharacterized protein n=1 Tax=Oidiodendron maius (strain Zn) TaxID=913774 RepID=A0A0C3DCX5_OIDMZ|nr:hypothetical protein OIDMADRAFT_19781 [Oidiodendron maius Zn]
MVHPTVSLDGKIWRSKQAETTLANGEKVKGSFKYIRRHRDHQGSSGGGGGEAEGGGGRKDTKEGEQGDKEEEEDEEKAKKEKKMEKEKTKKQRRSEAITEKVATEDDGSYAKQE